MALQVFHFGCAPSVALRGVFQRLPGPVGALGGSQHGGSGGQRLPRDEGGAGGFLSHGKPLFSAMEFDGVFHGVFYETIPIGSMYVIYGNMDPINIPTLC